MTAVIVLGGHRCGTSSVAGALAQLGIPAALPGDEIGASSSNPRGHFEDATLCRLHERMLGNGGWRNPSPLSAVPSRLERDYAAHLRRRASSAATWCVKDPRLCLLLPFLDAQLRRLAIAHRIVSVERNPDSAAESLHHRQRMSRDASRRIAWLYEGARRAQLARVATSADIPVLQISYDDLVRDPRSGVARLAEFVSVRVTADAIAFLEPALRHW